MLSHLDRLGVSTSNNQCTPIVELPLAPGYDLGVAADELWRRGVYVTLAAYPLVPRDRVGLRVQLTAAHTDADVDQLVAALSALVGAGALSIS